MLCRLYHNSAVLARCFWHFLDGVAEYMRFIARQNILAETISVVYRTDEIVGDRQKTVWSI